MSFNKRRDDLYKLQVPNAALFDLNITHCEAHVIQSFIVSVFLCFCLYWTVDVSCCWMVIGWERVTFAHVLGVNCLSVASPLYCECVFFPNCSIVFCAFLMNV